VAGAKPERGEGSAEHADLDAALRRARAGDENAFRELWCALQPRLLRYLAVKAAPVADDVAAETWLQVVRDLARFRGDADDFRAWLFTVARNRAIDAARASSARPVVLMPNTPDVLSACVSAEAQALERLSTQSALRLVASLPADQAELVALRVIAGLDVAAVAEITGRSPGAVRVGVHRALRLLSTRVGATSSTEVEVP
jgi:RNA polymerase sigma-70 factor (ECF subfamily)